MPAGTSVLRSIDFDELRWVTCPKCGKTGNRKSYLCRSCYRSYPVINTVLCKFCSKETTSQSNYPLCQSCRSDLIEAYREDYDRSKRRTISWTFEEDQFLRDNYPIQGGKFCANALHRDYNQTLNHALDLGLYRDKTAKFQLFSERMKRNNPRHTTVGEENFQKSLCRRIDSGEARKVAIHASRSNQRTRPSTLELFARRILDKYEIPYDPNVIINNAMYVDLLLPGNIILEIDGDYWHGHSRFEPLTPTQLAQQRRDRGNTISLQKWGYRVHRIWESDLSERTILTILVQENLLSESQLTRLDPSSLREKGMTPSYDRSNPAFDSQDKI